MTTRSPLTNSLPEDIRRRELAYARTLPTRQEVDARMRKRGVEPVSLTWRQRGPNNVGGRTRAIGIDLDDENIILAGGDSGGMWRSTDGGVNWTKTTKNDQIHSATTIAQDPRTGNRQTWYYGTGEASSSAAATEWSAYFRGDGIFKSTDGGLNWTLLPSTSVDSPHTSMGDFQYVTTVKVSTTTGDVYAALGYSGGLKVSRDGGTTWTTSINTGGSVGSRGVDVAISSTGIVYAVVAANRAESGIWRSSDDGTTWTDISPTGWVKDKSRLVLDIAPSNENIVYILSEPFGLWKYTYQSGDGSGAGGQWEDRSANKPLDTGPNDMERWNSQSGYDLYVRVKPDDENTVFIAGTDLYRSTDGFTTTSNIKVIGGYLGSPCCTYYPNHHPDNHTAVFAPGKPNVMYSGHDGGISKTLDVSANQVAWIYSNGYLTTQFYHVSIDQSGTEANLIAGGMQDNSTFITTTVNNKDPWTDVLSGDGMMSAVGKSATMMVAMSQNGGIAARKLPYPSRFAHGGFWHPLKPFGSNNPGLWNDGYQWLNPIALNPADDKMLFYVGARGINTIWRIGDMENCDWGVSCIESNDVWYNNEYEEMTNTDKGNTIASLSLSTANPAHLLYYATENGGVYKVADANSGDNLPTDISPTGAPATGWPISIQVNPEDGNEVLLIYSNYEVISVWHTSDGGTNWTNVGGNLEENPDGSGNGPSVRWGIILPYSGQKYYLLGTSVGVWSTSLLNGTSTVWGLEGANTIGNVVVAALAGRASDGLVVAGTHGRGVFSASYGGSSDVTPPTVQNLSPQDDVTGVGVNDDLVITLDEDIAKGTGNITIYNSDQSVFEQIDVTGSKVTVSNAIVTINPDGTFQSPGSYYVNVASSTIQDASGNAYAGIQDNTTWNFATVDAVAPKVATLIPSDDAVDVAVGVSLVMTMDENVSSGSGDIVIYNPDDTVFETIPITDAKVTIANDQVTVDPTSDLAENTVYYVQVAATALTDASANAYAGIQDKTTWNFTTIDPPATPNTAPVLAAVADTTIDEDKTVEVTLSATDAEDDPLTYSATSTKTEVTISISSDKLILTPQSGWNGEAHITASASDGNLQDSKTFKLTVSGVNDPPVIVNPINITINEDDSTTIKLFATDPEGDPITFTSNPDTFSVQTFLSNDTLKIIPVANWNGTSEISVNATDGTLSDFESFTLTVTPVNDLPTAVNLYAPSNDLSVIINDNTYSDSLIFAWSESYDADGDTLIYSWVGTGGLEQLDIPDTTAHEMTIAYSDIYNMIDQSHLSHWSEASQISGTWTIVVKDKEANIQAVNGPFNMTILESVLALDGRDLLPDIFALHENYPNPFNPVTTITYDLPERIMVRLTVFDITGRRIREIVNGYQEAGFQSALWEGTDDRDQPVSGGLYFYQLKAGEFVETRKMLLIK